ncbi:hypothetical protein AAG747_28525 [Rapidithrix thailandica]|uniref:Uncharacterized protein n=1 Tax=Rapidithrix thailandica TaxID=413964 RepID=A0AAW9SFP3_9BACT
MYKYLFFFILFIPFNAFCQGAGEQGESYSKEEVESPQTGKATFWSDSKVDFSIIFDPFNKPVHGGGLLVKWKKRWFKTKHFEGYTGLAVQYYYDEETDKLSTWVKGYNHDLSGYLVSEWIYYPFRACGVFLGIEPFAGITNLRSDGRLRFDRFNLYEEFTNTYTFFNYGVSQSVGYQLNNVHLSIFALASLKGYLDSGRTRPTDQDAKIFLGANVSLAIE